MTHSSQRLEPADWLVGVKRDDTVLLVLNQPIARPDIFAKAWSSCKYKVVTDGGANKLMELNNLDFIPDMVIGDFDSIDPDAREYYVKHGVQFVTDKSVYATDFMKAMENSRKKFGHVQRFLAFNALGGRVDHCWHSYLCLSKATLAGDELILVSDQSITIAVNKGEYKIGTPRSVVGETCGFAPLIDGSVKVTTKGFEWDVEDWPMSFTTQLSTSNFIRADEIEIKTNGLTLLTVEIRPHQ